MNRLEILSKFTTVELLNPVTRASVIEALGEHPEQPTKEDIENLGEPMWSQSQMHDLLDRDPYREYQDQEVRELNSR